MLQEELCKKKEIIAYKSCVDSYLYSKDKKDVYYYWLQMIDSKRMCEAKGVEKALELIDLYEEINGKD